MMGFSAGGKLLQAATELSFGFFIALFSQINLNAESTWLKVLPRPGEIKL
jgi:hypothetical protein